MEEKLRCNPYQQRKTAHLGGYLFSYTVIPLGLVLKGGIRVGKTNHFILLSESIEKVSSGILFSATLIPSFAIRAVSSIRFHKTLSAP